MRITGGRRAAGRGCFGGSGRRLPSPRSCPDCDPLPRRRPQPPCPIRLSLHKRWRAPSVVTRSPRKIKLGWGEVGVNGRNGALCPAISRGNASRGRRGGGGGGLRRLGTLGCRNREKNRQGPRAERQGPSVCPQGAVHRERGTRPGRGAVSLGPGTARPPTPDRGGMLRDAAGPERSPSLPTRDPLPARATGV